jgi:hypothetical protein
VTRRTPFGRLVLYLVALSLALVGAGSAAPAKLTGAVGPGHAIDLRFGGKRVTTLQAGVA